MKNFKHIVNLAIIISLYYFVYYIYIGLIYPIPAPGDSWDYHIPIAVSILDGSFLSNFHSTIPQYHYPDTSIALHQIPQWYYPGSSEAINAFFVFFNIPTLSNVFAAIVLFFACFKLGLTFRLPRNYALLFAITFSTLNVILRWLNAVSIDVWVGVWFVLSLILFENPKKNLMYFAKLGFVLGMLIGSKYTALYFLITLIIFYSKKILPFITLARLSMFFIPFSVFGLFWYIRNYIFTQNPFYPLSIFGFKGENIFGGYTTLNVSLIHPVEMLNAGFGEYKLWILTIILGIILVGHKFLIKKQYNIDRTIKLFLIGLINFSFFLTFPTSEQVWIMVSSFRYSLPVFIPLMLGAFLLASKYKKEEFIGYFAIANMLPVLSMAYYPKLVLIYFPLALITFYFLKKNE